METAALPLLALEPTLPASVAGQTSFHFHLARGMEAELAVYDLQGHRIALPLPAARLEAGPHEVGWQPEGIEAGTYIFQLSAEGERKARLLTLTA